MMASHDIILSKEGQANMRRARETLKPGDVVWYLHSLNLITSNKNEVISYRKLFPHNGTGTYLFHSDWELVAHEPHLLEAHDA